MPFYDGIDQRIEKWSQIIYFLVAKITVSILIMPKVLSSVYSYMNFLKDPNENYELELPLPIYMVSSIEIFFPSFAFPTAHTLGVSSLRLTFDATNPFGYAFAVIVQYFMIRYIALILVIKQSILVGLFCVTISLTDDITNDLKLMNDSAQSEVKRSEAMKQLYDFVELHSAAKQLSQLITAILHKSALFLLSEPNGYVVSFLRLIHGFSDISQLIFVVYYALSIFTICSTLLLVQVEIVKHSGTRHSFVENI